MKTILIVDDEPKIRRVLTGYLEQAGFRAVTAEDGPLGLAAFRHERPDLVLLDLMLPGMDGMEVCNRLRRESNVPIIMVTARAEEVDRLLGLELGADDYIVKPFSPREVVARVRAVLRRTEGMVGSSEVLHAGDLVLDIAGHKVTVAGRSIDLTPTEFNILAALARVPGRPLSRSQLLEQTQEALYDGMDRTIDVHISNLRAKIEPDPKNPHYLITVFGVGYRLEECGG
jgi:two-component system alkaline phosphatase synthesis response regulator PhoP